MHHTWIWTNTCSVTQWLASLSVTFESDIQLPIRERFSLTKHHGQMCNILPYVGELGCKPWLRNQVTWHFPWFSLNCLHRWWDHNPKLGHGCLILYLFQFPICQASYNLTIKSELPGGWDSSVSIATRYRLEGPGIKSWWGRDFPHLSRLALGPTQPPVQWVPGLSRRQRRLGRNVEHPPPSMPRSWKSRAIPLLPLWDRVACYRVKPYLTLPSELPTMLLNKPYVEGTLKRTELCTLKSETKTCQQHVTIWSYRHRLWRKSAIFALRKECNIATRHDMQRYDPAVVLTDIGISAWRTSLFQKIQIQLHSKSGRRSDQEATPQLSIHQHKIDPTVTNHSY
jgi:hypothetical protein